jgi:hypothetical protein
VTGTADDRVTAASRTVLAGAAGLALAVQLVVVYAPSGPGTSPFPGADKVVHLLVFAVPVLLLLLAGAPVRVVLPLLAAHAVLSEVVQGVWLTHRSGDPLDALADLAGVLVGWAGWKLVRHLRARSA